MHVLLEPPPNPMPPAAERRYIAAALRHAPGHALRLCAIKNEHVARQYAHCIRNAMNGMYMFAPAGSFEVAVKTMFDFTYIYIRCTGQQEDPES